MEFEAKKLNIDELKEKARTLRQHIIRMTTQAGSGHPSSSLSAVEVVTALFFGGFMRYDPVRPDWPERPDSKAELDGNNRDEPPRVPVTHAGFAP